MVGAVSSGAPSEPETLRPDLSMPLPPLEGVAAAIRRGLTVLREPTFARAHRQTRWLVAVAVALVVAGQVAVVGWLRGPVTAGGVVLAAYTALRVISLTACERRQYAFEPVWLAERSATLQTGHFEVVRLTVDGQMCDLADPDTVGELVRRTDGDVGVVLDFAYHPASLERVYRRLADLRFHPILRRGAPAQARFPQARYELQPSGHKTYWLLGEPVVLSVAGPADRGAARAGTGSADRPGGAHQADARHQERT
jgi:hypothetical protein